MIKNLFLPEQIRGSFIFDQTYLGLEITKTSLAGTKIKVSGKKASILDFYYVPVIKKENETAEESTISALNDLHKKTGSCHVKLSLPNNIAIFKELSFPFLEKEKIKQVLPYELDPQIPFSIHDIAFDFIITKQDKERYLAVLDKTRNWIDNHASEQYKFELQEKPSSTGLSAKQKTALSDLAKALSMRKELVKIFGEVAQKNDISMKEFFQAVYQVLVGKERGPRLAPFIESIGRSKIKNIIEKAK